MHDTWGSFAAFSRNTSLLSKTIRFTWKHFHDGIDHGDDDDDDDDDDDEGDDESLMMSTFVHNWIIIFISMRIMNLNQWSKLTFFLKYQSVKCLQIQIYLKLFGGKFCQ